MSNFYLKFSFFNFNKFLIFQSLNFLKNKAKIVIKQSQKT